MKLIRLFSAMLIALSACAARAGNTTSPEFEQFLKENETQRQTGATNPQQFLAKVRTFADRGDPSAQFLIALASAQQDHELARTFFSQSAKRGCSGSEMGLGIIAMSEHRTQEGVARVKAAASKGDVSAYAMISGMHKRGDDGFEKSLPRAYAWAKLAADQSPSMGARAAVEAALPKLHDAMTDSQRAEASAVYAEISRKFPKAKYFLCGQFNPDASLDPTVPSYLQPVH